MNKKRLLLIISALALCAFFLTIAGKGRADAPTPVFTQVSFGMVGIAPSQRVRVNVVFIPGSASAPADPSRIKTVEIGFVDSAGTSLLPAVQGTLHEGQATFVDIDWGDIPAGAASRVEIRPVVNLPDGEGPEEDVAANVEVFDVATGRTEAVYELPARSPHNYNHLSDAGVVRFGQSQ